MIRNSSRAINLLTKIDVDYITTGINNQVAAFDTYGNLYGISSNQGNFLKDNGNGSYSFEKPTVDDVDFDLTPGFALVSSNTGSIKDSIITETKLNYLYNVSSDIQT